MKESTVGRVILPGTFLDALERKAEYGADVMVVAGGTDAVLAVRRGAREPRWLMQLPARTHEVAVLQGGLLRICALATHAEMAAEPLIRRHAPALAAAVSQIGAPHIRNVGTLGGNLGNASPASDASPALLIPRRVIQ